MEVHGISMWFTFTIVLILCTLYPLVLISIWWFPQQILCILIYIYIHIYIIIYIYIYQWHSIYTSIPTNIGFTTRYYWILTDNGTITQINSFCLRAAGMSKHQGFDHQDRADGPKIWACLDLEIWYLPVKQIRIGICDQNIMKDTPNNVILRSV